MGSYTFEPSLQRIILHGFSNLSIEQILLITNVADNVIIYNFADKNKVASLSISGSDYILTLNYDISFMDVTDNLQIYIDYKDAEFILIDEDKRKISITETKELKVFSSPPCIPENTVKVEKIKYSNVFNVHTDFYTIPNLKKLVIQRFLSGSRTSNGGDVCELYKDVLGDGSTLEIIGIHFTNGSNEVSNLITEIEGNGIIRILMRRKRLSGGVSKIYAHWIGYLKDI